MREPCRQTNFPPLPQQSSVRGTQRLFSIKYLFGEASIDYYYSTSLSRVISHVAKNTSFPETVSLNKAVFFFLIKVSEQQIL